MTAVLELPVTDGRWLRSIRTRAAIVEAWLALIAEGDLSPTAKGVADRARIGLRTVFQHFSDMNSLHHAAGEELLSRILPTVVEVPADLDLTARIQAVVRGHGEAFEAVTALRRACERQEWLSIEIGELIDVCEQFFRAAAVRALAVELDESGAERDVVETAVDLALSWATWNQLRQRRHLAVEESCAAIERTLAALLRADLPVSAPRS